jgi:AcrR family transcriptional regulator
MSEQQILKASLKLFARYGYDYVSVRKLAGEADVNIGSISYYFQNKIGILERIVEDFYQGLDLVVDPILDTPNSESKKQSIIKLTYTVLEYMCSEHEASRIVTREITLDTDRFDAMVRPHNIRFYNNLIHYFEQLGMESPQKAAIKFMALVRFPFSNGNVLEHYYQEPFNAKFLNDYTEIVFSSLHSELSA